MLLRMSHAASEGEPGAPRVASPEELREWRREFEAAAKRPLRQRFRSFETTREYREWCEANLPSFLGYGRSL